MAIAVSRKLVFGYPRITSHPFRWTEFESEPFLLQTFDDVIELLEQLEIQNPTDVVVQADAGVSAALRLCRVIGQHSDVAIHIVALTVTEQQSAAAYAVGIRSIREFTNAYPRLIRQITSRGALVTRSFSPIITVGTLQIDSSRRTVHIGINRLQLTRTEFDLLKALVDHLGELCSRETLIERVWGKDWHGVSNILDTHLVHLRSKMLAAGHANAIVTVRGSGFYFEQQIDAAALSTEEHR